MRIWDLAAGYLNRQSLLGEHRELHGLHSILINGKSGYARHPETLRWVGAVDALVWRHAQLAAEMRLRGFSDRTPLAADSGYVRWPETFVTDPLEQVALLRRKYADREKGRIPLPQSAHDLWAQHKYSVMARSPEDYRRIGRAVARARRTNARRFMAELARELVAFLRERPSRRRAVNAIEHMWGYVSRHADAAERKRAADPTEMLRLTYVLALRHRERYIIASTAVSELAVHLESA